MPINSKYLHLKVSLYVVKILISSYKIDKYLCIYEDSFGAKILRNDCAQQSTHCEIFQPSLSIITSQLCKYLVILDCMIYGSMDDSDFFLIS